MTKKAENHTLGAADTYIAHIREYPPPGNGKTTAKYPLFTHETRFRKSTCEPFTLVTNLTYHYLHVHVIKLEMCNHYYKNCL